MDKLDEYRQIIRKVLSRYVDIEYANVKVFNKPVFDENSDQYVIISWGWDQGKRHHGCLIHVNIKDSYVWIQRDGTEDGVVREFLAEGIPKTSIVMGFHLPEDRCLTEFADRDDY